MASIRDTLCCYQPLWRRERAVGVRAGAFSFLFSRSLSSAVFLFSVLFDLGL
jgi:hypothetical protein